MSQKIIAQIGYTFFELASSKDLATLTEIIGRSTELHHVFGGRASGRSYATTEKAIELSVEIKVVDYLTLAEADELLKESGHKEQLEEACCMPIDDDTETL